VLDDDGQVIRKGITVEEAEKVLAAGGRISGPGLLHLQVRYFVDGVAIGGKRFVEEAFARVRGRWKVKRENGARRSRGVDLGGLFTLRDLRGDVIE